MAHISDLSSATQIKSGDVLPMDRGSSTLKIDYNVLAKCIIEQYSGSSLGGTAQSVKNALDTIQTDHFDLTRGTLISNGTDLNSLTAVGTYYCPSSSSAESYSNCPITNRGFKMVVMETSYTAPSYVIQTIYSGMGSGVNGYVVEYTRTYGSSSSGWTPWIQALTRADFNTAFVSHGTLPTGTDLDTVRDVGVYLLASKNTYTHAPSTYGMLEVVNAIGQATSISTIMQRLTIKGKIYTRYNDGSSWYHWREFSGTELDI